MSNKKGLIRLLLLVVVVAAIYLISLPIMHAGKVAVTVSYLPLNAAATLDGKKIHSGTAYLKPGTYTFAVSSPGFTSAKQSTVISPKQHYLLLALAGNSTAATYYADQHKAAYQAYEGLYGKMSEASGAVYQTANPILGKLPFQDPYFSIGYRSNADGSLVVTVHTQSPRYRYLALQQIRGWGFDPANYQIEFSDYTNPLGSK